MAKWCGQGGNIVNVTGAPVTIGVFDWELDEKTRLVETTDTNSQGYAQWAGCLVEGRLKFNAAWDDTQIPENGGMVKGAVIALQLFVGGSGKKYTGSMIVETLSVKNDARGIVTYAVDGPTQGVINGPA